MVVRPLFVGAAAGECRGWDFHGWYCRGWRWYSHFCHSRRCHDRDAADCPSVRGLLRLHHWNSPVRMARTTAAVLLGAASLRMALRMWKSMVFFDSPRIWATS